MSCPRCFADKTSRSRGWIEQIGDIALEEIYPAVEMVNKKIKPAPGRVAEVIKLDVAQIIPSRIREAQI
jgi:hypothetical protein